VNYYSGKPLEVLSLKGLLGFLHLFVGISKPPNMSFGKFSAALSAFHNETTLALLNINLDFSLIKMVPPKEFEGLGASLSRQRRVTAESGTPHRIARKLGALFEQIVPFTPELVSAYGRRVSEISQAASTSPKGNKSDGPFADQVGIDGTAIWAAATSGPSAIPVLMLACMLARIWEGPQATALWVEIIEQRQAEIRKHCDGSRAGDLPTLQAFNAMQQEFPRSHLAEWDASVRAWLRTADEAKAADQRQLMLIVRNINLPVNNNMNVYQSVLTAWKNAMDSMNSLVKGAPQRVQDGALLLGLSAWHLYPDMIVFGSTNKEIRFQDALIQTGAILTVGLQNDENHDEGVFWSLPLAHLRYYGEPIQSIRSISHDTSHVPLEYLSLIVLGAVYSTWGEPISNIIGHATWLGELCDSLHRIAAGESKGGTRSSDSQSRAKALLQDRGWFGFLTNAGKSLIASVGSERETYMKLASFGMRRCATFLAAQKSHPRPFFGLTDAPTVLPLIPDPDERVLALRELCRRYHPEDFDRGDLIIRYKGPDRGHHSSSYEYASVETIPLSLESQNLALCSSSETPKRHRRWIAVKAKNESLESRLEDGPELTCECVGSCMPPTKYSQNCQCAYYHGGCTENCPCSDDQENAQAMVRDLNISEPGEDDTLEQPRFCETNESLKHRNEFVEKRKVALAQETVVVQTLEGFVKCMEDCRRGWDAEGSDKGDDFNNASLYKDTWEKHSTDLEVALEHSPWNEQGCPVSFIQRIRAVFGDANTAIFERVDSQTPRMVSADERHRFFTTIRRFPYQGLSDIFSRDAIDSSLLYDHLERVADSATWDAFFTSLRALAAAAEVYKLLPGATINLGITTRPLHTALWVPPKTGPFSMKLDRARAFSCIANLESGSFDIDPGLLKQVMAMSTGNSIFVAAPLLCDPSEHPADHEVRRVFGNISRAGISMLIPPKDPRTRKLEPMTWDLINHAPFDGKVEDSFAGTSMHLSFTNYTYPINLGHHGLQDAEAYFIESLISIHDRDRWVADIDPLGTFDSPLFSRLTSPGSCPHTIGPGKYEGLVSLDNWEELLDGGHMSGVVRAKGNWIARLAATAVGVKLGYNTVVIGESCCWKCVDATSTIKTYVF